MNANPIRAILLIAWIAMSAAAGPAPTVTGPGTPGPRELRAPEGAGETVRIGAPGHYFISREMAVSGRNFEIAADGVTLDLNRMTLRGEGKTAHGIAVLPGVEDAAILNGILAGWGGDGIHAPDAGWVTLGNVTIRDCGGDGARLGNYARAEHCGFVSNRGAGLSAGAGASVSDCRAVSNGGFGFRLGGRARVSDCAASANRAGGISAGDGAVFEGLTAFNNGGDGIAAGRGSVLRGCSSVSNIESGFVAGYSSILAQCVADLNQKHGIVVRDGSVLANSVANDSGEKGIDAARGVTIDAAAVRSNQNTGVELAPGSALIHTALSNNGTAIRAPRGGVLIVDPVTEGNRATGRWAAPAEIRGGTFFETGEN